MKYCGLTAVILMVLVVKGLFSVCPENGYECGEACVDANNDWCNNEDGRECSCKKRCLIFNKLANPGEEISIYCRDCRCPATDNEGVAECSTSHWCKPDNVILHIDYPYDNGENPKCFTGPIEDDEEFQMTN